MTYLLDTHCLGWLLGERERLDPVAAGLLLDRENRVLVSAASAMETATKTRIGKWDMSALVTSWSARLRDLDLGELAIDTQDALLAGSLDWAHRDPFDRLLVAQAIRHNLVLVTVDRAILRFRGIRTLTW